jgi:hypothetical protein
LKKFDAIFIENNNSLQNYENVSLLIKSACLEMSLFEWHECSENLLQAFFNSGRPKIFVKSIPNVSYFSESKKFSNTLSASIKKNKPFKSIVGCFYVCFQKFEENTQAALAEALAWGHADEFNYFADPLVDYTVPCTVAFVSQVPPTQLKFQLSAQFSTLVQSLENIEELSKLHQKIENLEEQVQKINFSIHENKT